MRSSTCIYTINKLFDTIPKTKLRSLNFIKALSAWQRLYIIAGEYWCVPSDFSYKNNIL